VLIPEENVKDLQEIPENAKNNLEIVPVRWIDRVLEIALESTPQPLPDEDALPPQVEEGQSRTAVPATPLAASDTLPH
jgi:ATP-dependent Lon protease